MSRMRKKVSRGRSKRLFSKTASKTHKYNLRGSSMRGGYRL